MEQFNTLVSQFTTEYRKFLDTGNKAAGTRARIKASELKTLLTVIRLDIQNIKKGETLHG